MIDPNSSIVPMVFDVGQKTHETPGLTIRAYIASQQLAAIVSLHSGQAIEIDGPVCVRGAVKLADLLIVELNKEGK